MRPSAIRKTMSTEPDKADDVVEDEKQPQGEMTFVEHLVELRDRLLRVVLAVLCFLVVLFPFANDLYAVLAESLCQLCSQFSGRLHGSV